MAGDGMGAVRIRFETKGQGDGGREADDLGTQPGVVPLEPHALACGSHETREGRACRRSVSSTGSSEQWRGHWRACESGRRRKGGPATRHGR